MSALDRAYEPNTLLPGTVYRVLREIGQGGMGRVYEVEDKTIGKRYALKVLRGAHASGSDEVERMEAESRTLVRVAHPNVVDVVTAGVTTDGAIFYVMELLSGRSLRKVLKDVARLRPTEALAIGMDIGDALAQAHEAGVVHRDVKPDNIFMVKRKNGTTQSKLLDFGVAAMLDNLRVSLRETGKLLGTPRYASPEQQRGEKAHPGMDIWALGYVLFEAIVGHGPFRGRTLQEIIVAVQSPEPAFRLSEFLPEIPESLDNLLASMLEKDAERRATWMGDVTDRLREIFDSLGAPAKPRGPEESTLETMFGLVHRTSPGEGMGRAQPVAEPAQRPGTEGSSTGTPPFFAEPPGSLLRSSREANVTRPLPVPGSLLAAGEVAEGEQDSEALDRAWGLASVEACALAPIGSVASSVERSGSSRAAAGPESEGSRSGREETSPAWQHSGSLPAVRSPLRARALLVGVAIGTCALGLAGAFRFVHKAPTPSVSVAGASSRAGGVEFVTAAAPPAQASPAIALPNAVASGDILVDRASMDGGMVLAPGPSGAAAPATRPAGAVPLAHVSSPRKTPGASPLPSSIASVGTPASAPSAASSKKPHYDEF